jgi:conjugative relaxase-like TrwC/TraI family protein
VLGVRGLRRDGADYYLSDLGRELPVAVPASWTGTAAAGLGLSGPLGRGDEFRRLLSGRHPMASSRVTVAAFDLTFSAPKSASVLFALADRDTARQVVAAHEAAVAGALTYLEAHAVSAARRDVVVATSGLVAARFTHAVSRAGDPHLHSHVVMANLVHGADGRWSACDRRGLDAHRRAGAAVYEAHLRAGLTAALGVRWSAPLGRSGEVVGISPAVLGAFSSRRADIRRRIHETGARSARGRHVAWAATRPAKEQGAGYDDARRDWQRRAREVGGLGDLELAAPRRGQALDEHCVAAVLSVTPHGGARRRDVVAAFASAARAGVDAASLERLVAHWVPAGTVGVAEPIHPRRAAVPGPHLFAALGPRPLDPRQHEVWVEAATTIDTYRDRWGVERSPEPLGVARDELAGLAPARLAHHLGALRQVETARARLGRRDPVTLELALGR